MSQPNFIDRVKAFGKSEADPDAFEMDKRVFANIRKYMQKPDFDLQKVERASQAAKLLFIWITSIVRFYEVYLEITPKKQRVAELQ